MRKFVFILLVSLNLIASPVYAKLNVFACEPEWASLANELGGKKLNIFIATTGLQDPHRIEARPSLIAKMRRADLVICSGAELEVGWLPLLLRASGNNKVQVGRSGYVEAAMMVDRLDVPLVVDRAMGDIHPYGNPHVHLDPRRVAIIAGVIGKKLAELDRSNAQYYQQHTQEFLQRWNAKLTQWQERAEALQSMGAVAHHKDWVYLFDWLGINEVATLEPKPGVPPTAGHLAQLKKLLTDRPAKIVVRAAYQDDKASRWLHDQTGIKIVVLPYTVGGNDQATDLFALFDNTIDLLLSALQ